MQRNRNLTLRSLSLCVDETKKTGVDWWVGNPVYHRQEHQRTLASALASIGARMTTLEAAFIKEETPAKKLASPSHKPHAPLVLRGVVKQLGLPGLVGNRLSPAATFQDK
jgi:hypothetical protein